MSNCTFYSVTALRERGWTARLLRDLLSEPDARRLNPIYPTAAPMRLYAAARVEAAEALPAFTAARKRRARANAAQPVGAALHVALLRAIRAEDAAAHAAGRRWPRVNPTPVAPRPR